MWTPVITVVQRWFAPNRRGLALGILSTGYGMGFATMGIAFPWIVANFNWRYSWFFLGAGALVMVLANGFLLRSDPESGGWSQWGAVKVADAKGPSGNPEPGGSISLAEILRNRVFWLIRMSYFSISFCLYGITTFMVDYARYQLGVPLEQASLLATIHGTCQIAGVLTILPLSDYLGRKRTLAISSAVITACLLGIILWGGSWTLLCVLIGVTAVFYGAVWPLYGACAGDYFPKEVMGTVIGAWTPFYGSGAIIVHWVSGMLRDTTGSYDQSFLINAGMAALAVCLMVLVRNDR